MSEEKAWELLRRRAAPREGRRRAQALRGAPRRGEAAPGVHQEGHGHPPARSGRRGGRGRRAGVRRRDSAWSGSCSSGRGSPRTWEPRPGCCATSATPTGCSSIPERLDLDVARRMAIGAEDLLDGVRTVPTLDEAVADCAWVVGTESRRVRGRPPLEPEALAAAVAEVAAAGADGTRLRRRAGRAARRGAGALRRALPDPVAGATALPQPGPGGRRLRLRAPTRRPARASGRGAGRRRPLAAADDAELLRVEAALRDAARGRRVPARPRAARRPRPVPDAAAGTPDPQGVPPLDRRPAPRGAKGGSVTAVRPRRSALYVPGANARALEKAASLGADVIIVDLEDAVAPAAKEEARRAAVEAIRRGMGPAEVVLRVNGAGTPWAEADLAGRGRLRRGRRPPPQGGRTRRRPRGRAAPARPPGPRTSLALWAMIETPRGVLRAAEVAAASPRLACLVAGTSDLVKDLRARHTAARTEVLVSLSLVVLAARASGLAALDGVHLDLADDAGFAEACRQGRDLGFDGKTLIHPRTIAAANLAFTPGDEELAAGPPGHRGPRRGRGGRAGGGGGRRPARRGAARRRGPPGAWRSPRRSRPGTDRIRRVAVPTLEEIRRALALRPPELLPERLPRRAAVSIVLREPPSGLGGALHPARRAGGGPLVGPRGLPGRPGRARRGDRGGGHPRRRRRRSGSTCGPAPSGSAPSTRSRPSAGGGPSGSPSSRGSGRFAPTPARSASRPRWRARTGSGSADLLDPARRAPFPYVHEGRPLVLPSLDVDGLVIWGLTYRMVEIFAEVLGAGRRGPEFTPGGARGSRSS